MKSKHTEGKWESKIPKKTLHKDCRWIVCGQKFIAKVYGNTQHIESEEETEANARLIASAPELLEACKRTFEAIKGGYVDVTEAAILNNAIIKAEGVE